MDRLISPQAVFTRLSDINSPYIGPVYGELNEQVGGYYIDVAFTAEDMRIALEYDAWYWHAHNAEYDARRDGELINAGWRILRIKSGKEVPTKEQLEAAIARLKAGEMQAEIELDDWGAGPARFPASTQ